MQRRTWIGLFGWLALCYGIAAFGSRFQAGAWYDQLTRPALTPPGWVFGVVWSVLYGLMAIAAWLVWKRRGLAAALLLPYLLWVTFATFLNFEIWRLNAASP